MRFCHSYSTKPLQIDLYGIGGLKRLIGNIWYFALSVAYLKNLRQEIVLHTDTFGKALLGHLPYDQIYLTCDNLPEEIHPRFWAQSKFYALLEEPLGSIHIDGDVFIKRGEVLDIISEENYDVLVQCCEGKYSYTEESATFERDLDFLLRFGDLDLHKEGLIYNTGLLRFMDEDLLKKFVTGYINCSKHFSWISEDLLSENSRTPDLILEQQRLGALVDKFGKNLSCLLEEPFKESADNIGYQHVMTSLKYSEISKVKEVLRKINPEIYSNTYKLCRNI